MPRAREQSQPPDRFDESTPPAGAAPGAPPVGPWVELPPGEGVAAHFARWDKGGRAPEGSVPLRFVGTLDERGRWGGGGYEVVAGAGLGPVGSTPSAGGLGPWAIAAWVGEKGKAGRWHVVMAPREG